MAIMGEKRDFIFNTLPWFDEGLNLIPLEAFSFDGEIDGIIANLGFLNEYEEMDISSTFKDLFSISFSEKYMPFLVGINPEDTTDADVLLISMRLLDNVYSEMKTLEENGVFKKVNPKLVGCLDRLKELTNGMIEGNLSTGDELFDMMYSISLVQDINNDAELDTAVFDFMTLLTPIVENSSTFDLEDSMSEIINLDLDDLPDDLPQEIMEELGKFSELTDILETSEEYGDSINKLINGDPDDFEESLKELMELNEKALKELKELRKDIDDGLDET